MLAIAAALTEYRIFIEGCKHVTVITDHRPLVHIPTQTKIMRRHVPWVAIISQYLNYMTIVYRKGEDNDADGLSRRPDLMDLTEEFIDKTHLLKPNLRPMMRESSKENLSLCTIAWPK